ARPPPPPPCWARSMLTWRPAAAAAAADSPVAGQVTFPETVTASPAVISDALVWMLILQPRVDAAGAGGVAGAEASPVSVVPAWRAARSWARAAWRWERSASR